jgi:hypothetical protein
VKSDTEEIAKVEYEPKNGRPPDDHDPGAALRRQVITSDRSGPGPFGSGFFVCLINKSGKLQDQRLTPEKFRTYH